MLLGKYYVLCLQETHGTRAEWVELQNELRNSHKVYYSNTSNNPRLGGVAFFVQNELLERAVRPPKLTVLLEGRAAVIRFDFQDGYVTILNVHVHQFDSATARAIANRAIQLTKSAQADPQGRNVHYNVGDWNHLEANELPVRVGKDAPQDRKTKDIQEQIQKRKHWTNLYNCTVELHQPEPTRIGHTTHSNTTLPTDTTEYTPHTNLGKLPYLR